MFLVAFCLFVVVVAWLRQRSRRGRCGFRGGAVEGDNGAVLETDAFAVRRWLFHGRGGRGVEEEEENGKDAGDCGEDTPAHDMILLAASAMKVFSECCEWVVAAVNAEMSRNRRAG